MVIGIKDSSSRDSFAEKDCGFPLGYVYVIVKNDFVEIIEKFINSNLLS